MPRIHGRRPEAFPGILARHRATFSDDELTAEMLPDGCWEIVISQAGWMRLSRLGAAAAGPGQLPAEDRPAREACGAAQDPLH